MVRDIPTGIYTSPEISSLGKTERELTEAKIPYEIGHASFKSLARAQITGQTTGMLKILFHRETLEILASIASARKRARSSTSPSDHAPTGREQHADVLHQHDVNYPTMAEAYASRR